VSRLREVSLAQVQGLSHQAKLTIAAIVPLPIVAAALAWDFNPWVAFVLIAVAVGVIAEVLGTNAGCLCALAGGVGFVLVYAERTDRVGSARGGPELGALAGFLIFAVLFGHDRPGER
jgi:hypothetical protein